MHIFKDGLDIVKERISELEIDMERSFQKKYRETKVRKKYEKG